MSEPLRIEDMLLTIEDMMALLKIGRTTLQRWIALGKVPPPVTRLSHKIPYWSGAEIQGWIRAGMPDAKRWKAMQEKVEA